MSLDEPLDDVPRGVLALHLERCPDCTRFAHEIGLAAQLLRRAPLERFRLPPGKSAAGAHPGSPHAWPQPRSRSFAVGVASLAGGAAAPAPGVTIERRAVLSPIKLPIGQRMAEPEFTAAVREA